MRLRTLCAFLIGLALLAGPLVSARAASSLTILVVDTSRPMGERWEGDEKLGHARDFIASLVAGIPASESLALITLGGDSCRAEQAVVPTQAGEAAQLVDFKLSSAKPAGSRALIHGIASALEMAEHAGVDHARLVVLTSGLDQCAEEFASLEAAARPEGRTVEIAGYGIDIYPGQDELLTQGFGQIGGTFQSFASAPTFQGAVATVQTAGQAGLRVLVNLPSDLEDADPEARVSARLEIYNSRTGGLIWDGAIEGSQFLDLPPGLYDVMVRYAGDSRWNREVRVTGDAPAVVQVDFSRGAANLRVELYDEIGTAILGAIEIIDSASEATVYASSGLEAYAVHLPEGDYEVTARVGDAEVTEGIALEEGDEVVFPLYLAATLGQALLSINNEDAEPVSGTILIYDRTNDTLVEQHDAVSWVRTSLPTGEYEAIARVGEQEQAQTFDVAEGDETEVYFEMDVPMGSLFVTLSDEGGNPVFGMLRVYTADGTEIPHYELEQYEDTQFSFSLPAGVYSIRASSDGIERVVSSVAVRPDEETEVELVFPEGTSGF